MCDVKFLRGEKSAYTALETKDNKTFYYLTDTNQLYVGAHELTNKDLDVADIALAAEAGGVVTIKGLKEVDGKIEVSADSSLDVVFAKVATTGAAEDVTTTAINDGKATPTQIYAASSVQGILEAIARDLKNLTSESVVTVEKLATATTGYFASYAIKQNGVQVGNTIDIPKDYLVKGADVRTVEIADNPYAGAAVGDLYIDFVINVRDASETAEHLYLPLKTLIKAFSGGSNAETTVTISDSNVITVTITKIAASKIAYSNTTSGSAVEETVQDALARLDGDNTVAGSVAKKVKDAIDGLDATVNAVTDSTVTDTEKVAVVTGVTETNGVITAVGSVDADRAGAATRAKEAVIGTTSDLKTADTIKGVKNFIGTIPATATADTIIGYIDEKTGDGVSALDSSATIASKSGNVVTIKGGLTEVDGVVTNDSSTDIVLDDVAVTGKAEDVSVTTNVVTANDVEAAIVELAGALTWGSI